MSVIRINKLDNYVTMSKNHLKEKDMSLRAKGLLSEMLSLPDDWDYSLEGLAKLNKESVNTIRAILNELKDFGYLVITKLLPNQTESGRIEYIYDIYEISQLDNNNKKQEHKKQDIEKQDVEIQYIEKQDIENYRQLNNNILNNKILNNNNNNIYTMVIDYLNQKTNQNYRHNSQKTKKLINARINEGYSIDDFKKVIDNKANDWLDTDMAKYLRPETLFGNKFENYLNQPSKENNLPSWFGKEIKKEVEEDEYDKLAEQYTRGYLDT